MTSKRRVEDQPPNPYDSSNCISKLLFSWLNPFIREGFKRELVIEDLYRAPSEDLSKDLGYRLRIEWEKEVRIHNAGKKASFFRALSRTFGFWYMMSMIWIIVGECIVRPLQAISLGWIIRDVNSYLALDPGAAPNLVDQLYWQVFYDGLILLAFSTVALLVTHPYVFSTQHDGMKLRVACCNLIFRHSLKLSNAAIGQTTVGQMVNLLTNDVNRFDIALNYIQFLVVAPIQAIIVMVILSWNYLGIYSTISGSALLLLYVPFQSLMGRWFGRLRQSTAIRTDERIRLMNEIMPAMRVIKMYTWEEPFGKLVELARRNEVKLIRYTSILRGINMALFFVASKVILFVCFITYVLLGYTLAPEVVFVSITLFNAVRLLMTLFFPYGVAQLAETLISCNRLQEFLLLPQQEPSHRVDRGPEVVDPKEARVECNNVCANWTIINRNFVEDDSKGKRPGESSEPPSIVQRDSNISDSLKKLYSSGNLASGLDISSKDTNFSKNSLLASSSNVHLATGADRLTSAPGAGSAIAAIRNVTYKVKAGELMTIVGPVGSGKSSVLMSILGELPLASGRMQIRGKISYAAQEPWIFAGTVKDNVLFGKPINEEKYREVLRVCSLDRDIRLFPQRDDTIVGERGVSLSGGQRARINLARAIYHEADIYLLDDPLSAVDTTVARHIFNECICGYLKSKVVILATHQTQFLQKDSKVLHLHGGRQIACKSPADSEALLKFIGMNQMDGPAETAGKTSRRPGSQKVGDTLLEGGSSGSSSGEEDPAKLEATGSQSTTATPPADLAGSSAEERSEKSDDQDGDISGEPIIKQQVESSATNSVGCATYWYYIKASTATFLVITLALANLGTQALFNGTDFWLSYWTDTEQRKAANGGSMDYPPVTLTDELTLQENAIVYTILIAGLFILTLIRTTSFFVLCMRSSIELHNRLFYSVLKAPIKFFDYNPIGVLLNRVSRDMGIVDDLLPPTAFDAIEILVNVLGILVTVGVIYPLSLLPAVALCLIVGIIRLLYMRTVRSIKCIEGVTRSPVFSHLATSLNGLATIRAFRVETEFERKFDEYQDIHSSAWFLFIAASRWLSISLDWLSLSYIAIITMVMTLTVGSTTGSQLGLAISSALVISGSFQWGVRQSTEMESQMTSVARIREYSELPEEPPRHSSNPPPPEWPEHGSIQFNEVNLRYFEKEDPVLKSLSFSIKAGEKIGIVGRTGAGKSSIITVLFRLIEPEGSISIDGIDTKSIGLHELRKKLSIIPQEPILFNGPIRRNLDPFNEYDDVALWNSLVKVKLSEVVKKLPGKLDAELNEGGSNFSVGQRQLICLARAVLRENKIIILDEATANVDPKTDRFIQSTISEYFKGCTRLTIAHRLNTIMDSDRVLVMDSGQVKEFDVPHLLLQREDSFLSMMVRNAGKNGPHLRKIAKQSYEEKRESEQRATI